MENLKKAAALILFVASSPGWTQLDERGNQLFFQGQDGLAGVAELGDRFGQTLASGNFNNDGIDDLVVGVPLEDANDLRDAGAVQVIYGRPGGLETLRNQLWIQGTAELSGALEAGDLFGASLAVGDFNADGFDDLAIGSPGEAIGSITGAGVVIVMYGSALGLTAFDDQLWSQDSPGVLGVAEERDQFGYALAAGDFDGDFYDDLAVGAVGEDIDGVIDAGVVHILFGSDVGISAQGNQLWYEGSPGVPGGPEEFDRFGEVLAAGAVNADNFDDLVVGMPSENVGDVINAGAVNVFYGSQSGITASGSRQLFTAGNDDRDRLGESIAIGSFNGDEFADIAAGAPGKDLGAGEDEGGVLMLFGGAAGIDTNFRWIFHDLQGSFALPQEVQAFGVALVAADFDSDEIDDLAVGVMGRTVGGNFNAGMVHIFPGDPDQLYTSRQQLWTQDSPGVAGQAEENDLLGASLVAGDFNGSGVPDLAIGARQEAIGTTISAGAVNVLYSLRPDALFSDGFEQ